MLEIIVVDILPNVHAIGQFRRVSYRVISVDVEH